MKIALVTGGSQGMGFEWCQYLAENGYKVILTGRNIEKVDQAAAKLNNQFLVVYPKAMDVTNESSIKEVKKWIDNKFGQLHLLINNAGINSGTRSKGNKDLQEKNLLLASLDKNEVLNMIDVNSIAPIIVARNFIDLLSKSGEGKIVNIGSWLGSITLKQNGGNYSYAVSKSALNMMNRALAFDLKPLNVISVVVNPGWVNTNMGGPNAQFSTQDAIHNMMENIVNRLTIEDTGMFFNYDGKIHPW